MSVNEKMTAIADTIRTYTGNTEKLRLEEMPAQIVSACRKENEEGYQQGYDQGLAEGHAAGGYSEGFTAGTDAERERFWTDYLNHRSRYSYAYLFAGNGWNDDTFCPPEDTVISVADLPSKSVSSMFMTSRITDLKRICEERNITLDFSAATGFSQFLSDSIITTFPTIDTRGASNLNNIFYAPQKLHTVEKLILKEDGSQTFNANSFYLCGALENVVVEGKFGASVDIHWSAKLTKESIESIVNALSDTASGKTLTLSKAAVDTAFFEEDAGDIPGSETVEWNDMVEEKENWTITLM